VLSTPTTDTETLPSLVIEIVISSPLQAFDLSDAFKTPSSLNSSLSFPFKPVVAVLTFANVTV